MTIVFAIAVSREWLKSFLVKYEWHSWMTSRMFFFLFRDSSVKVARQVCHHVQAPWGLPDLLSKTGGTTDGKRKAAFLDWFPWRRKNGNPGGKIKSTRGEHRTDEEGKKQENREKKMEALWPCFYICYFLFWPGSKFSDELLPMSGALRKYCLLNIYGSFFPLLRAKEKNKWLSEQ